MLYLREFFLFGLKQAWACLFGGLLLGAILLTQFWYPFPNLSRYDFLFLTAVAIQLALILLRLETPREVAVILLFHLVATGLELFKTSNAIQAWQYPGDGFFKIGHVPLLAGFMYSAVGSYIARIWRIFDFRFSRYPPLWGTLLLAVLIYVNFFSHHYVWDIRWLLLLGVLVLYGRVWVYYRIDRVYRRMPLVLGLGLVALFIWLAENIATFANIWLYPSQRAGWHPVAPAKILAWFLLMLVSFVLVSLVHRPRRWQGGEG
ncbi:MAG: DUF817 domain-containing protein [Ardenticatenaceae bacterium]|nr:DUF817 domain-containing protein [Anaerolineales bacterium]MCB8916917.1 DUF817 domain-containing protein [Ardenticatenaceae bacterium]